MFAWQKCFHLVKIASILLCKCQVAILLALNYKWHFCFMSFNFVGFQLYGTVHSCLQLLYVGAPAEWSDRFKFVEKQKESSGRRRPIGRYGTLQTSEGVFKKLPNSTARRWHSSNGRRRFKVLHRPVGRLSVLQQGQFLSFVRVMANITDSFSGSWRRLCISESALGKTRMRGGT